MCADPTITEEQAFSMRILQETIGQRTLWNVGAGGRDPYVCYAPPDLRRGLREY